MRARPRDGRPFLVPVAAVATVGVAWLAVAAREHDSLSRFDPVAARDVLRLRTPTLTDLAQALTFVGGEVVVGALAVIVLTFLLVRRQVARAATFAVGVGGSAFLTVAVKLLVERARPGSTYRLGTFDASYSFPSGHTLNSAVFLMLVVWLLWPTAVAAQRGALVVGATLLAVGVGASRVYLGYHWLTDVLASGLIAVAWGAVVLLLRERIERVVSASRLVLSRRPGTAAAGPPPPDRAAHRL